MTQSQIATFIRARTPYRVTTRRGCVVAWLDPWHGAIVRTGKRPTVVATIPDPSCMWAFILLTFLTLGLVGFLWHFVNQKSTDAEREIRTVFARELSIIYK